jgi:dihydrodipicolinate synthase/N-acetylneuraminate lyase
MTCLPVVPTDDGRVNEAALRAVLEDNIRHGVHGFWIAGSTGEGPILDDEQRAVAARVAAETGRKQSAVIREAIDQYLQRVGSPDRLSQLKAARGMWSDRDIGLEDLRGDFDRF